MKNVLLYYSFSFSFGGGEPLPLSLAAALQKTSRLTLALDVPEKLEPAIRLCGIPVDTAAMDVVKVSRPGYDPLRHSARDSLYRSRRLKALAAGADVCISAANVMDFGRPGHHFINMLAFGDDAFTAHVFGPRHPSLPASPLARAKRGLSEALLRPLLGMRSKRAIIRDPAERVYPNSAFVERLMAEFYGPFRSTVFYPPTLFAPAPAAAVRRDPLAILCLGRIIPEKGIPGLVAVVERARAATGLDLRFRVAGRLDQDPAHGRELRRLAATRPWLDFPGPLHGADKEAFLCSGTYALHALRTEAFGISVTEYLKAGLIPVVPDTGGAAEVVDSPDLSFRDDAHAARILAALVSDAPFRDACARHCAARAALFSPQAYLDRQTALLSRILAGPS